MQPMPACASGRCTNLLDGRIHFTRVKHGGIVATAAPFGGLGADRILHVLDTLAVPLIVERRKVMRGAIPFVVDILMAALARIGLHEEFAGNLLVAVNLRRAGEESTVWTVAFTVHAGGGIVGIFDSRTIQPASMAEVPRAIAESREQNKADAYPRERRSRARSHPAAFARPLGKHNANSGNAQNDMGI